MFWGKLLQEYFVKHYKELICLLGMLEKYFLIWFKCVSFTALDSFVSMS